MACVLHVESDKTVREVVRKAFGPTPHELVSCASIAEIPKGELYDLTICGPLNKHSDGLLYAVERALKGEKVIIIAHRRKFSKVPFIGTAALNDPDRARAMFETLLAGE